MVKIIIKFKKCGEVVAPVLVPHVAKLWLEDRKTKRDLAKVAEVLSVESTELVHADTSGK